MSNLTTTQLLHSFVKCVLHAFLCMFICPFFPHPSHASLSSPFFLALVFPFLLPGNLLQCVSPLYQSVLVLTGWGYFYLQESSLESGSEVIESVLIYFELSVGIAQVDRNVTGEGGNLIRSYFCWWEILKSFSCLTAGWRAQTEPESDHAAEIPAARRGEHHTGCGQTTSGGVEKENLFQKKARIKNE